MFSPLLGLTVRIKIILPKAHSGGFHELTRTKRPAPSKQASANVGSFLVSPQLRLQLGPHLLPHSPPQIPKSCLYAFSITVNPPVLLSTIAAF